MWAPNASRVRLRLGAPGHAGLETAETVELDAKPGGWWRAAVAGKLAGRDCGFLFDGAEGLLPDPRSRR